MDPDQTAPIGAVCSGSTLFASVLNSSVILGSYLQQTTSADDIFRCIFFLGALMVKVQNFQNPELQKFKSKNLQYAYKICKTVKLKWIIIFRDTENKSNAMH